MIVSRASLAVSLLCPLALWACVIQPPQKAEGQDKTEDQTKTEDAKADAADEADPKTKYALTEEELALLEKDPKDLGPDENRKRAQALRKKIMQNPDSAAAKALEEARQAALAGQLDTSAINEKGDSGVVIEAPDYLRKVDASHDPSVVEGAKGVE